MTAIGRLGLLGAHSLAQATSSWAGRCPGNVSGGKRRSDKISPYDASIQYSPSQGDFHPAIPITKASTTANTPSASAHTVCASSFTRRNILLG
jgi:hypothetical protein